MKLRALLAEDRAVSPVVGVVLMVGITVILMGIIGTFVLGSTPGESSPNANFVITQLNDTAVDVRYAGGEPAFHENMGVQVNGNTALNNKTDQPAFSEDGVIKKDENVLIRQYEENGGTEPIQSGDTVSVVWVSDDGQRSDVIESRELL